MTTPRTEHVGAPRGAWDAPRLSHPPAHADATTNGNAVGFALGLALVIVVSEYLARRILAPTLPIIGTPTVNDMLAVAFCYVLLVTLTALAAAPLPAALGRTLLTVLARAGSWLPWVGGVLFLLAVMFLVLLDTALWGSVTLPSWMPRPSDTVLMAGLATPLAMATLLVVNGVVIPIAEERLWRGLIQPRLFVAWGLLPALLVTAVLFSLKHAIVDASLGRLLAITAGGLVLGFVAHRAGGSDGGRYGWQTSAVSHMIANIIGTCIALVAGAL